MVVGPRFSRCKFYVSASKLASTVPEEDEADSWKFYALDDMFDCFSMEVSWCVRTLAGVCSG